MKFQDNLFIIFISFFLLAGFFAQTVCAAEKTVQLNIPGCTS